MNNTNKTELNIEDLMLHILLSLERIENITNKNKIIESPKFDNCTFVSVKDKDFFIKINVFDEQKRVMITNTKDLSFNEILTKDDNQNIVDFSIQIANKICEITDKIHLELLNKMSLNNPEEKSPLVFEDTRVFEEEQLITIRIPTETLNAYKDLANKAGVNVGKIMIHTLKVLSSNLHNELNYKVL